MTADREKRRGEGTPPYDNIYPHVLPAGTIRNNAQTNCATRACRACLDEITCVAVMYLTLRTGCERHARVTRLPRPFPAYAVYHLHPSYPNKGKVGVQRGRKTAGCPSFLPLPRGAARSRRPQTANPPAAVQRKTPRPERANTPVAVRVPRSAGAEKGCRPLGARPLTQFACPDQSVQKWSLPTVRA